MSRARGNSVLIIGIVVSILAAVAFLLLTSGKKGSLLGGLSASSSSSSGSGGGGSSASSGGGEGGSSSSSGGGDDDSDDPCKGFKPMPSEKKNKYDSASSAGQIGGDSYEREHAADLEAQREEQEERDKQALAALKQQGMNQKDLEAYEENMEKLRNANDDDARKYNEKINSEDDASAMREADDERAEVQKRLIEQLKEKKLNADTYLKKMEIATQAAHQKRMDEAKKLNIQIVGEEKILKIKLTADAQRRKEDLKDEKEKHKYSLGKSGMEYTAAKQVVSDLKKGDKKSFFAKKEEPRKLNEFGVSAKFSLSSLLRPPEDELKGKEGINPNWDTGRDWWTGKRRHPPVKKYENMVPSGMEYYNGRDLTSLQDDAYFLGEKRVSTLGGKDPAEECATICYEGGMKEKCQGFILGPSPEFEVEDYKTCIFFSKKAGLGKDGEGNSLGVKDRRDTYMMEYCSDSRKQFWSEDPCSSYEGTELDPKGDCPVGFDFKDKHFCETGGECRNPGTSSKSNCKRTACNPFVISTNTAKGKYCDACKYKNTVGDRLGDLTLCDKCDSNHVDFNPSKPGDCKCKPEFANRDPSTNCMDCLPGFFGMDCSLTANDCGGRGKPLPSSVKDNVLCSCNTKGKDGKGDFPVYFDGDKCDKCQEGYGPEPSVSKKYACSIQISDTKCSNTKTPILFADPRDVSKVTCDCSSRNKFFTLPENGGEPGGKWSGPACDICNVMEKGKKAYGGENCNLGRDVCNLRGTPGEKGKFGAGQQKDCMCDPELHFRSGLDSTCKDGDCEEGWYGKNCDVKMGACGSVNGYEFSPVESLKALATPSDPKCDCETDKTGMILSGGKCICPTGTVLKKGSNPPVCENVDDMCSHRGKYDTKSGKCKCDPGYSGDKCGSCSDGFANFLGTSTKNICEKVVDKCHGSTQVVQVGGRQKCKCDPGYDESKGEYCTSCSEGYVQYSLPVPKGDGSMFPAKTNRCIPLTDICGTNASDFVGGRCVCKKSPEGVPFSGNTTPFGDGKTKDPSPKDAENPLPNEVCAFTPSFCNYPLGVPSSNGCRCKPAATLADGKSVSGISGSRCQFTRQHTCNDKGDANMDGTCSCDAGWLGKDCKFPPKCKGNPCTSCDPVNSTWTHPGGFLGLTTIHECPSSCCGKIGNPSPCLGPICSNDPSFPKASTYLKEKLKEEVDDDPCTCLNPGKPEESGSVMRAKTVAGGLFGAVTTIFRDTNYPTRYSDSLYAHYVPVQYKA